jgi:hypothetical protein
VVLESARKHGVSDFDILHAYRHPIRVFVMDDLVILAGADQSGRLLEVLRRLMAWSSSLMPSPPENDPEVK